ncbi:MAG: hypothetical protein ACKVOK_06600 [Flavobacteriales bacterium]
MVIWSISFHIGDLGNAILFLFILGLYFLSGYLLTKVRTPWYRYFGVAVIGTLLWLRCFYISPDTTNYKSDHNAGCWFNCKLFVMVDSPLNFIDSLNSEENYSVRREQVQILLVPILISLFQYAGGAVKMKKMR